MSQIIKKWFIFLTKISSFYKIPLCCQYSATFEQVYYGFGNGGQLRNSARHNFLYLTFTFTSFRQEVFARDKDLQARGFSNVQLVCDKQPGNSDLLIDLLNIHKYCYSNLNRLISQVVYTLERVSRQIKRFKYGGQY